MEDSKMTENTMRSLHCNGKRINENQHKILTVRKKKIKIFRKGEKKIRKRKN